VSSNKWIKPPPNTVDKLEAKGIFGPGLARVVRAYYLGVLQKNAVSDEAVREILNQVVHQLMLPERATARRVTRRYILISLEHASHVALEHNDPTRQTARDAGVSRKTVNIACARYPVSHEISKPAARKMLGRLRSERKKLAAENRDLKIISKITSRSSPR
jgi:hypothetical protein